MVVLKEEQVHVLHESKGENERTDYFCFSLLVLLLKLGRLHHFPRAHEPSLAPVSPWASPRPACEGRASSDEATQTMGKGAAKLFIYPYLGQCKSKCLNFKSITISELVKGRQIMLTYVGRVFCTLSSLMFGHS